MNTDMTLSQVKRMKEWIVQQYASHHKACMLCCHNMSCPDLERLFTLLCRWTMRFVDMQWQEALSESEEAS